MLDDNELDLRLRAAAERVVSAPIAPPRRVVDLEPTARTRGDRRSLRSVAGLTAIAVVVSTFAFVVVRDSRQSTKVEVSPNPKRAYEVDKDGLPLELPGISKEQMLAHLGAGLPTDSARFDHGDARLWVPPNWSYAHDRGDPASAHGSECGSFLGSSPGIVTEGDGHCTGQPAFTSSVKVDQLSATQVRKVNPLHVDRVVNGYGLFRIAESPEFVVYAVPELGVALRSQGAGADAVIATLAPSSLAVVDARGAGRARGPSMC